MVQSLMLLGGHTILASLVSCSWRGSFFAVVKGVEIDPVANCVICKILRTPFSTLDKMA